MNVADVKKGMRVEIITKQGKVAKGFVEDVATKNSYYGVIVRLKSGEIGSVRKILMTNEDIGKKDSEEILKIIGKGESFYVEFKSSSLWSANLSENEIRQSKSFDLHSFKQKASKVILAKSIAAFLNSGGGSLIIGVKEIKDGNGKFEITGIDDEFKKLKDSNNDGYKRMLIDDVIRSFFSPRIYNHLNDYLWINFVEVNVGNNTSPSKDGGNLKKLCWIKIKKCDVNVFLKINDKEIFMIRTDTENRALEGEKLVDYCMKRFRNTI